jgi:hypothetical protein
VPKRAVFDPASMDVAIQELQSSSELSLRAVANNYGIPRTSLQFKLKNPRHKESFGPSPVLSHEDVWSRNLCAAVCGSVCCVS